MKRLTEQASSGTTRSLSFSPWSGQNHCQVWLFQSLAKPSKCTQNISFLFAFVFCFLLPHYLWVLTFSCTHFETLMQKLRCKMAKKGQPRAASVQKQAPLCGDRSVLRAGVLLDLAYTKEVCGLAWSPVVSRPQRFSKQFVCVSMCVCVFIFLCNFDLSFPTWPKLFPSDRKQVLKQNIKHVDRQKKL